MDYFSHQVRSFFLTLQIVICLKISRLSKFWSPLHLLIPSLISSLSCAQLSIFSCFHIRSQLSSSDNFNVVSPSLASTLSGRSHIWHLKDVSNSTRLSLTCLRSRCLIVRQSNPNSPCKLFYRLSFPNIWTVDGHLLEASSRPVKHSFPSFEQ